MTTRKDTSDAAKEIDEDDLSTEDVSEVKSDEEEIQRVLNWL